MPLSSNILRQFGLQGLNLKEIFGYTMGTLTTITSLGSFSREQYLVNEGMIEVDDQSFFWSQTGKFLYCLTSIGAMVFWYQHAKEENKYEKANRELLFDLKKTIRDTLGEMEARQDRRDGEREAKQDKRDEKMIELLQTIADRLA